MLYSLGHQIRGLNMTILESFVVNMTPDDNVTSDEVQSLDVDAIQRHVYWVNDGHMRRAAIPSDSTQLPIVQLLRNVSNARGIAFDWITRYVSEEHREEGKEGSRRGIKEEARSE